jgi:NO-binding membrane sensor protein with MHYT domain
MSSANGVITGFYDYGNVARSIVIVIAASYAALDLAAVVTAGSRTPPKTNSPLYSPSSSQGGVNADKPQSS